MIDNALTLVIPSSSIQDHDGSDLDKLIATYGILNIAKDDFLAQKLTFDEYMQLVESAEINVDSYMESIEINLVALKLM
jgi:hypothetical protein